MTLDQINARRIAIIKPSALGDIVHALPVLTALRARFPVARITWVVNASLEPLIAGHPDLTDTLPFDRGAFKGLRGGLAAAWGFAAELRRRQFDLVIDMQGLFRSGLMALASGAPRRVGFRNAREGSRYAYTHKLAAPARTEGHAVDRMWAVAEAFGVGHLPKTFRVPVRTDERITARAELMTLPRPWVAVAVGAKWVTKRWPAPHFAELLNRAQSHFGGSAVFVGGHEDTPAVREVMTGLRGPALDLTGRTSLPRLSAALSLADVMVGNDTGPLHLAAALGVPCVAPYLCTKVASHGPYAQAANCVETAVACGGSYIKKCPNMVCLPDLTADRLWPKLAEVLDTWQHARSSRSA
ncbi:glycosyltransferase family 9 protein [Gemmata sp. JC717]|uniref:glycosyltransferase family 9 protein n=1 Tax=Gemmata algarum TaxID=2975278 RepID=UPI0021BB68E1|nr:glycosyltransferase family 9 protein [Gemmata algarum]MDY3553910.1 glycosyltransferase family 9 protein [Gemmata algarum]